MKQSTNEVNTMSKFTLKTIVGAATLAQDIEDYRGGFRDIKKDGHAILVSCIFHGMPANLETGADGKSLKNPGNGTFINRFLEVVAESHPQYVPNMRAFLKAHSPFEIEEGKVKFKEARFRAMGGDRQKIVDDIHTLSGTWYDLTRDKKSKAKERPDVAKKLASLVKLIKGLENLSEQEQAILTGLLKIAEIAKVELPKE